MLGRWTAAACLLVIIVFTYTHVLLVNPTTAALTFLLLIQWLAAYWGIVIAVAVSGVAALCFNYYFLPPIHTFVISGTENWVALAAFIASALIGSNLASRLQAARAASERRGRDLERLYDLGQRLIAPDNPAELLRALPASIAAAFQCRGTAIYLVQDAQIHASCPDSTLPADLLKQAAQASAPLAGPTPGSVFVPLAIGVRPVGAIYMASVSDSIYPFAESLPSAETLEAMSSLVALSLERAAAIEKLVHAEAAAESDRLRATLLDAIAHDLRTPLTSIKASVTSLLTQSGLRGDQRHELLTVIDEESDRLNQLIAQAVEMAELDARAVRLERRACVLAALAEEVLAEARLRWPDRSFILAAAGPPATASIDPALIAKVLLHLIENAAKYSTAGSPVQVAIGVDGTRLSVAVADQGPGIPAAEQLLIFNKFYRNPAHRYRAKGTGMGLPIARAIVEAHGGALGVESQESTGSTFCFTLPTDS